MRPHKPNPPFTLHKKPKATFRIPHTPGLVHLLPHPRTHTGASKRPGVELLGDLLAVRTPVQVWEDFIHIAKWYFNTEVSLYKLLSRHRELRVRGPKLK